MSSMPDSLNHFSSFLKGNFCHDELRNLQILAH
jgi:hypothetical protein